MPKITIYAIQNQETREYQLLHQLKQAEDTYQSHKKIHGIPLTINCHYMTEHITPFLKNETVYQQLLAQDVCCLPMVFLNDVLVISGRLPTISEWEQFTQSGISLQEPELS